MKEWAIGLGTTDACNLNCPHCYSRQSLSHQLSLEQVNQIINSVNIKTLNFGTGENYLNKDFGKIIDLVSERGIKSSLTSNGYSVNSMSPEQLKTFNDIDISIEFPSEKDQSAFRGKESWNMAISAIERCLEYGVETSIACCMMNINYDKIQYFTELLQKYGINLRINIYKPVNTEKYMLSYTQFWEGVQNVFSSMNIIACSEPIINAVMGRKDEKLQCACGRESIRIKPNGDVMPCVYWNKTDMKIEHLQLLSDNTFNYIHVLPEECKNCEYVSICAGGCSGRRVYRNLNRADEYCPFLRNDKIELKYRFTENSAQKDLVHASYLCTLIMCL